MRGGEFEDGLSEGGEVANAGVINQIIDFFGCQRCDWCRGHTECGIDELGGPSPRLLENFSPHRRSSKVVNAQDIGLFDL